MKKSRPHVVQTVIYNFMKNDHLKISIENPCRKIDWTKMSDFDKGKFCTICSKNVTDFSKMTDEQIIDILDRSEASVCARLNKSQMNRVLKTKTTHKINFINRFLTTFTFITISALSYSNTVKYCTYNFQQNRIDLYENDQKTEYNLYSNDSIRKIIKGKVIDEVFENPKQVKVFVKGTLIRTKSDSLGNFQITIPKHYKKAEVTLLVKADGFEDDTEVTIKVSELPKFDIIIKKNAMAIGQIIKNRKRWWQFWR
jgi:hypothetical protein